jgi:sedoheptulose-bisphosphatase
MATNVLARPRMVVQCSAVQPHRNQVRTWNSFSRDPLRVKSIRLSSSKCLGRSALSTKCEIGDSLEQFLTKATPDKNLIRLLMGMGEAMRTISFKVRTASCGSTACVNTFGDEQLAVDLLANKVLFEALQYSHVCKYACSEEVPELQDMGGPIEGSLIN